jgi:preprotein translocase subunit YajC
MEYKRLLTRVAILVVIIIIFSILYYTICRSADNWKGTDEDITYFDALYFTLNTITTVGSSSFVEASMTCRVITLFLYVIILAAIFGFLADIY